MRRSRLADSCLPDTAIMVYYLDHEFPQSHCRSAIGVSSGRFVLFLEERLVTIWLLIGLLVPVLAGTLLIWAALALAGRADETAPTPKPTAGE
jgi:hypothetical protein